MLWFEPRGSVRSLLQLTTTPAWCIHNHRRSQAGAVERIRGIDSRRSTTDRPESRPLPCVRISACSSVSTFQQPPWQRQAVSEPIGMGISSYLSRTRAPLHRCWLGRGRHYQQDEHHCTLTGFAGCCRAGRDHQASACRQGLRVGSCRHQTTAPTLQHPPGQSTYRPSRQARGHFAFCIFIFF